MKCSEFFALAWCVFAKTMALVLSFMMWPAFLMCVIAPPSWHGIKEMLAYQQQEVRCLSIKEQADIHRSIGEILKRADQKRNGYAPSDYFADLYVINELGKNMNVGIGFASPQAKIQHLQESMLANIKKGHYTYGDLESARDFFIKPTVKTKINWYKFFTKDFPYWFIVVYLRIMVLSIPFYLSRLLPLVRHFLHIQHGFS